MREHDKIDQSLGHDAAADVVMTLLVSRWPLDERVCARAAVGALLGVELSRRCAGVLLPPGW